MYIKPGSMMKAIPVVGVLAAFIGFSSAIPATNHIPTAINQASAGDANTSNATTNPPNLAFDKRFQVPGTDTVLWITDGLRVDFTALQILFQQAEADIDHKIAEHGAEAVPGRNPFAAKYEFLKRLPNGVECYFVISAYSRGALTYRLAKETLTGLKIYLLDQARDVKVLFEVGSQGQRQAFGGLSVSALAEPMQDLSNDTAVASHPTNLTGLTDLDIRLKCSFGKYVHLAIIALLLSDTEYDIKAKMRSEGVKGLLPGTAGEWERDGHRGCVFRIDGLAPAHITWQMTNAAVAGLRTLLVGGQIPREATCTMIIGQDIVGMTSLKKNVLGVSSS